ncbi:MAG: hypothetical protein QOJ70_3737, partial [Acidobacteriota bacterium]|nr:hypothetical protein [Acidobacteriota bacterium]
MNELIFTLRPLADTAGWALVHSLWQGALVAVLYACFASLAARARPDARYAVAIFALVLMLVLPVVTAAALAMRSERGLFARETLTS